MSRLTPRWIAGFMEPPVASKRVVEVTVSVAGHAKVQWTARQVYDRKDDLGRLLTVLVGPESVRSFAVLARESATDGRRERSSRCFPCMNGESPRGWHQ